MPPRKRKAVSGAGASPAKKAKAASAGQTEDHYSEDKNYVFFYGNKCVFSQFHPAKFRDSEGRQYNCMEQYMHFHKAVTFKDGKMQKAIMEISDPKTQKKCGRQVTNFDQKVWGRESMRIVKEGSKLKYNQNPAMKMILYKTRPKQLVEASPRDRLWGVGMGQNNPNIHDPKCWRGKNLLGIVLTETRDELMKADGMFETGETSGEKSEVKSNKGEVKIEVKKDKGEVKCEKNDKMEVKSEVSRDKGDLKSEMRDEREVKHEGKREKADVKRENSDKREVKIEVQSDKRLESGAKKDNREAKSEVKQVGGSELKRDKAEVKSGPKSDKREVKSEENSGKGEVKTGMKSDGEEKKEVKSDKGEVKSEMKSDEKEVKN
ncbi:uncharacterized protein LOC128214820 isoform X2 [Mya arenaria]|nr:uncharacterized protein LOC128214820 isoform X2 [Mya arenaria]XP_052777451.1 uncharacterized protein LOC128214820 isoform X2 [Mya arenaria]XP_052777452.1 uncharacterized protein LOC128214820 isoform X2 [Mya arenaria]